MLHCYSSKYLSRPIFLLEKDSPNLKRTPQSELTKMLLGHLDKSTIITGSDGKCPHVDSGAIMIDFLYVTRKLSSVELKDVTTFGIFAMLVYAVYRRILIRALKYI